MNWRRRLCFLAGQVGVMTLVRFLLQWNVKFAEQADPSALANASSSTLPVTLLQVSLVGLAMFAFRVFDGVTDPLAGAVSDGWVRRGRERRSLLWGALVLPPIGLVLTFLPTFGMTPGLRWAFFAGGMFVFFVGYTFYAIPYWSLVEDYAGEDGSERRVLSAMLGAGILLATAVSGIVSGYAIAAYGYGKAAMIFAGPAALLMALPYFAAPKTPPARPAAAATAASSPRHGEGLGGLWRGALEAFRHRRFLAFLLIFSGSQMAFTVITVAAPFITGRLLGSTQPEADVAKILGPFLGTAIPTFIFAPYLSRRFGWERVVAVASFLLAVVYAGTAALGESVIGSPMTTAMIVFACGGPFAACILGLEGEAITECARERGGEATSLYWGVFNFLVKALNGLATALTALLVTLGQLPGWERAAVRSMSIMAGLLLVAGLLAYTWVKRLPPAAPDAPPAAV